LNFFFCKFDLVSLTGTHFDDLDDINLNKLSYFVKHRKQKVIRRSGGLAVLFKKDIERHFYIIESHVEIVRNKHIERHDL